MDFLNILFIEQILTL